MKPKAFTMLLAIAMSVSIATGTNAKELHLQTGRVNLERGQNGDTYIDTGRIQLYVPRSRLGYRTSPRINSSYQYTRKRCTGGNLVHQYSRQVNGSRQNSSYSSTSRYQCHSNR